MSALSVDQKREALEAHLKRPLPKMPADQVEDLYANRFHGPDLPAYNEVVIDGQIYHKWKAPDPAAQEPAEEEAPEA